MGAVIGDILPLAIGIAISPLPIIAAILLLLSRRSRSASTGFLLGWLLGIVVAVAVFTLLSAILPRGGADASKPIAATITTVLGVLLLLLAVRQWRTRPHGDVEPQLPAWMAEIDGMTAGRALGLGFLLSALNPKNLLLGAAAGVAIGAAGLGAGEVAVAVVLFTVLAGSTVAIPVVGSLIAGDRIAGPLGALRAWLLSNNATVMAVLLLVIGVVLIGKGIGKY